MAAALPVAGHGVAGAAGLTRSPTGTHAEASLRGGPLWARILELQEEVEAVGACGLADAVLVGAATPPGRGEAAAVDGGADTQRAQRAQAVARLETAMRVIGDVAAAAIVVLRNG